LIRKEAGGKTNRRELRRAERRRQSLLWNVIVLGSLGVAVIMVAMVIFANLRPGPLPGEVAETALGEGQAVVNPGNPLPTYKKYPPSSGTHYSEGLPWSTPASDLSAELAEGYYLNNLARGGVVFLYQCETDCAALEEQFRELLADAPRDSQFNEVRILIGRYARDLEAPVVALAWQHRLNLAEFDSDTLLRWYRRFLNQGPTVRR
jgi:hypothetical protein